MYVHELLLNAQLLYWLVSLPLHATLGITIIKITCYALGLAVEE
jgi:hypothetical protein